MKYIASARTDKLKLLYCFMLFVCVRTLWMAGPERETHDIAGSSISTF